MEDIEQLTINTESYVKNNVAEATEKYSKFVRFNANLLLDRIVKAILKPGQTLEINFSDTMYETIMFNGEEVYWDQTNEYRPGTDEIDHAIVLANGTEIPELKPLARAITTVLEITNMYDLCKPNDVQVTG